LIQIESITIKEFRGIRDLSLDFKGGNYAVCGPNGTGKSGVVDAIEFVLTGNISRLSGEGRGDVSLKLHGPHVDRRDDPAKSRVTATVSIPSLGKTATIERSPKAPATVNVVPNDADVLAVLKLVAGHPEVVLSRRELIRYVLATPGKRAEEVQALLHLDQVEQVRSGLQKIANASEKQLPALEAAVKQAADNLLRAMGLPELTKARVLEATNAQRRILELSPLADLTQTTSLKDGISVLIAAKPQRIAKAQAQVDIRACRQALSDLADPTTSALTAEVTKALNALAADPNLLNQVKRESFLTTGLELVEADSCPFCDHPWHPEELKERVRAKVDLLKRIAEKRRAVEILIGPVISALRKTQASIDGLVRYATLATPPLPLDVGQQYSRQCRDWIQQLASLLPLADSIAALGSMSTVPQPVLDFVDGLEKLVNAIPDPTKQDAAREWLTIAQERLEDWKDTRRKQEAGAERARRARSISDRYAGVSDSILSNMYSAVERHFIQIYQLVHKTDEDKFTAKLTPSMGKLGFDVDFYGRGHFPPGAYHSEGHQDTMGLCLYLALMKHLQGDAFMFSVLDDVLMSVDSAHRREVCSMLKQAFPGTQFIVTTHDPIWLRHMKTEGVIGPGASVQFRNWSVDLGPNRCDDWDVWTEVKDYLDRNDVRAAAAALRHYLEYLSAELCHRLRAPVEFRGDAQYQLGELLPAAIGRFKKLLRNGKNAANSWNQKEIVEQLTAHEVEFGGLVEASKVEQWQINAAVHFNSWVNLSREDFAPVAQAMKDLVEAFTCHECHAYLRVIPERETARALVCDCGKTSINLQSKGA